MAGTLDFRGKTIASALLLLLSSTAPSLASIGCDAVNAGSMTGNLTVYPDEFTQTDFAIGDILTIIPVSSDPGGFQLLLSTDTQVAHYSMPSESGKPQTFVVTTAQQAAMLKIRLGSYNPGSVTTTCQTGQPEPPGPGADPSASASPSSRIVRNFVASRVSGILLSDPSATSILNRVGAGSPQQVASSGSGTTNIASSATAFGNAMGLGVGLGGAMGLDGHRYGNEALGANGSGNVQFSQSLSQIRRQASQARFERDRMALGAGDGGSLPHNYDNGTPWDIWVEGRYTAFDDDSGNFKRDGHVGVLYVGGDYRVADNIIVGVLAQFDWAKDSSSVLASKVDGNGWLVGPYMSARIHENIYLDLRAAWGQSSNDIDVAGATGSFDTSRWLVKGTLAGNWMYESWRITPSAEVSYITESADAFANSTGTLVAGQDVSLGRLQVGPEIGYRFAHTADTFIEPFAGIKGVWDFDNPNAAIINGVAVGPGDFWGRLQGGLNVTTTTGVNVRGLASWDGLGADDYNGYTLQGTINVPLN